MLLSTWSREQQIRLAWEENLLRAEMPHFQFNNRATFGNTTVNGSYTSTANNSYSLAVWLKAGFPHQAPGLYVTSPMPLYGHNGRAIQSYGTSHFMHVWESDWNTYVKICHWRDDNWSASYTIVSVIMKGLLWLEALEAHRRTGRKIDSYSLTY